MIKGRTEVDKYGNDYSHHSIIKGKDSHISSMVYVIPPHDGTGIVFDPDSCESIAAYLIIFVSTLGIVCHIQSHVLTITNVTMHH